MTPQTSPRGRLAASSLISGALGGLVVLVIGSVLIATDVIDTGDETREVVRQAPITQPAAGDEGEGRTVSDIYREEGRGVVFVEARGVSEEPSIFGMPPEEGQATGSGFVVDRDGTIITNAHVVEGSNDVSVRFGEDESPVDAEVLGRDPSTDLAVLKVDPADADNLQPIRLGSSSRVRVGDPVVAIGNPFGFTRTVTTGIVSAKQRRITAPNGFTIPNVLQTDASINPGNSGGPLLDSAGRVIGINSQIATGGGQGSVGIGFAVPIDTAKELLPELRRGEEIKRAYLGVDMVAVTEEIARDLNLPVDRGALLQAVVEGGPADEAGLRGGRTDTGAGVAAGGDLVVAIDGEPVRNSDDLASAVAERSPGDEVEIEYYRGDQRRTVSVTLGERPDELQTQAPEGGDELFPLP
jgi:S1-C subfamily serine protease